MNKEERTRLLKTKCGEENYKKLIKLNNLYLSDFVLKYVKLLNPGSVFISSDSEADMQYIRDRAVETGEEKELTIGGHTVHFDGYRDQARDKKQTRFLVPKGVNLGSGLNTIDKDEGLEEIYNAMRNIMYDRELYVLFFCLGPANSKFSIPAVQLTDSSYVAHSEIILYRPGYEEFRRLGNYKDFFQFIHSEGKIKDSVSVNVNERRIYMDTEEDIVYSINTQYGGNTIGHKKLAMRLGINRASKENWLTEHMFISGIHGPDNRITYFAGAFPSMCGKTSTAMIPGETIIGDDIAYVKKINNRVYAVNVEIGIFGIIKDINPADDPIIWRVLHEPNETIFSNVLITEDKDAYWVGKPGSVPKKGINHSGQWYPGKKDKEGNEIPPSHNNARFTTNLRNLENLDSKFNDPKGVEIRGIIYGGRDSDTWVPVQEAFDWNHGIITMGASIESETTAATLGKTGIRKFNPMSNLDFLSVPIGKYVDMNLKFGNSLENPLKIFSVNYFLKGSSDNYLNSKIDKRIWLKWMELRVHREVEAVNIGTGFIPKYDDLKMLFKKVLKKEYRQEDYIKQFTLRIPENLSKIDRIIKIYNEVGNRVPEILYKILEDQKYRLEQLKEQKGEYISPLAF